MWNKIDNGSTIGTIGSENGEISRDEEHIAGARLTIEKGGDTTPFSITSGVTGAFFIQHSYLLPRKLILNSTL